jgi:hypothetical protein
LFRAAGKTGTLSKEIHTAPPLRPERRLAGESFRAFSADVFALARRREVLIAIALFLAPCGTFSLTNILGGLGNNFHASQRVVSVLGGTGVLAAGIWGSMLLPGLAKRMPLRPLYIAIGAVGGVFTLGLILPPRTPGTSAVAVIGENVLQSLAIACSVAIAFETIGKHNPLAATTFTLASAAYAFPIVYVPIVDGWGYDRGGVAGSFAIDGGLGILASLLLGLLLFLLRRSGGRWLERNGKRGAGMRSARWMQGVSDEWHPEVAPRQGKSDRFRARRGRLTDTALRVSLIGLLEVWQRLAEHS